MTTNNSIHLEPAYGQYYTEYDPQLHQPVSYPQQYNADAIDVQKATVRYVFHSVQEEQSLLTDYRPQTKFQAR